ncbi:uncharacterized protein LOC119366587 [Triticum dicoccoides]|uniref:uncharacterized protein LOC119366587 n=1 Tax=Triticum dicoccoides TaxID=85692 RepID=UPI00188E6270|nr:uncharacterized protein LOC119366587 [Triticum dicoccoides]
MADFALGLAKTAVEGTLSRVQSAIDEETTLKAAAQQDLVFITGEFQMMQSFLNIASKERARNEVVRAWVRQLRDLAFDVEDCVEFVIHLDNDSTRNWVWRLVPFCMAPPRTRDLDSAVSELKLLKARVEEVSQRNTRYNLISDSGSNHIPSVVQLAPTAPSTMDILMELWEANGKHRGFCNLQKLITNEGNNLQVISLWGSSGSDIEGAQIINKAYCDPEINRIFKVRAWVKLLHPFNPDEFLKNLQTRLHASSRSCRAVNFKDKTSENDSMKQLTEQRYLVILEGIPSVADWEIIRMYLPDNNNGSRIIVSTKRIGDAIFLTGEPYRVSVLREFTGGHYLCAFYKKGSGRRNVMGDLIRLSKRAGVVSVWGTSDDKSSLVKEFRDEYRKRECIIDGWVDVAHPFILKDFYKSLLQSIHTDGIESAHGYPESFVDLHLELIEGYMERCLCWVLCNRDCLVVINGLQSTEDWQLIKSAFASDIKSYVIVITNDESVATSCVDHEYRALNGNDVGLHPSMQQVSDYNGYGDYEKVSRNIFLSNRAKYNIMSPMSQNKVSAKLVDSTGVTSVWGIAGVGKSTLVGDECARMSRPYGKFAWVDVPDPFDLVEFSRLLLLDFHQGNLKAMEAAAIGIMEGEDPIQGCREIMRQDGCIVIIDGLRSTYHWDLIETVFLSQPTTEAKIVVITTEQRIAKHCVKQQVDQMVNVKCAEDHEACEIFEKLIDPNGTELASRMGKVDLVKLVAKCGGLMKVVAAIGKVSWAFLEHMNDDFMFKLETDPQFHSLSGLLSWMHSYFDACPDSVKPCIFYLSVFPASSKIRRGYLLRRWIAEGYCRDTPGCTAKENAQKRLSELVELSIIQQATRQSNCLSELVQWSITQQATSKNNFKVNGFFLEYIISRPMEDNLVFALDGRCSPNTQRTGQHLTIMADWHRDQNVFESIDFARLRSLTVFGTWYPFFISDKMKRLRVLDLEDMIAVTNDDLEQIFLKLLSLKFISLRGCRKISRLPDTLEGLRQLQTLDVRFTSIVMLPSAIIKLHKLQYIRAGTDQDWTSASTSSELEGRDSSISAGQPTVPASPENPAQAARSPEASHRSMVPKVGWASKLSRTWSSCAPNHNGGVKVPVGIEKLAALHAVGVVNVSAAGGEAFLMHLAKLTQLLKLRVCGVNKKNWPLLCSALSDKNCRLESLSVRFDEDCLDDSFKPPMTLKSLKLYGPMSRLPDTIKALVNLKKLDLEMTITGPDDVHFFLKEKLPCMIILNRLCINVQGDQKVDLDSMAFPCFEFNWDDPCKPRVLKMDCSSKLEVIFRYGGIFEYVEVLIIQCSKGSSFRVSGGAGLSGMHGLKTVWLKGSYSEELRQQLKELVDDHSRKPVLKLEPLQ